MQNELELKVYEKPLLVLEIDLETKAGSPLLAPDFLPPFE